MTAKDLCFIYFSFMTVFSDLRRKDENKIKRMKVRQRKLLIKTLKEKMSRYPNWVSMCPKSTAATRRMRNILLHTCEGAPAVCWHFLCKNFSKEEPPALNNSAGNPHECKSKNVTKNLGRTKIHCQCLRCPTHPRCPLPSSLAPSKSLVNFLGNCLQQAFNCLAAG